MQQFKQIHCEYSQIANELNKAISPDTKIKVINIQRSFDGTNYKRMADVIIEITKR